MMVLEVLKLVLRHKISVYTGLCLWIATHENSGIVDIDLKNQKVTAKRNRISLSNLCLLKYICETYKTVYHIDVSYKETEDGLLVTFPLVNRVNPLLCLFLKLSTVQDSILADFKGFLEDPTVKAFKYFNPKVRTLVIWNADLEFRNIAKVNGHYVLFDLEDFYFLAYDETGQVIAPKELVKANSINKSNIPNGFTISVTKEDVLSFLAT